MTIVTKTIIGIDYSLTSPAVCVNIDGDAGLMFYYLTNKKKWTGQMSEDIIGYEHKEWQDPIQRFKYISDFALDIISPLLNPKYTLKAILLVRKAKVFFKSLKIVVFSNIDYKNKIFLTKRWFRVSLRKVPQEKATQTKT